MKDEVTRIQNIEGVFFKRDDLFNIAGAFGGKARTCFSLMKDSNRDFVTAGSRQSPQINLVAKIAKYLGLKCFAHCPEGALSQVLIEAKDFGAEIIQHKAGYNSVIIARALEHSKKENLCYIPFGMECQEAITQTRKQVVNIPAEIKRIVVPVGSAMSLAGILWGLNDIGRQVLVLGIQVGADPVKRLNKFAPLFWRSNRLLKIIKSDVDYHKQIEDNVFMGIDLDKIYEAKCIPYVQKGDLFWLVGNRNNKG